MEQTQIMQRQEKGQHIAKTSRITRTEKGWKVPSQTGQGDYLVISNGFEATCTFQPYESHNTYKPNKRR